MASIGTIIVIGVTCLIQLWSGSQAGTRTSTFSQHETSDLTSGFCIVDEPANVSRTRSLLNCAVICEYNPDCRYFTFARDTRECKLFHASSAHLGPSTSPCVFFIENSALTSIDLVEPSRVVTNPTESSNDTSPLFNPEAKDSTHVRTSTQLDQFSTKKGTFDIGTPTHLEEFESTPSQRNDVPTTSPNSFMTLFPDLKAPTTSKMASQFETMSSYPLLSTVVFQEVTSEQRTSESPSTQSTQSTKQSTESVIQSTQATSPSITSPLNSSPVSTQSTLQSTHSASHSTQSTPISTQSTLQSTQSSLQSTQSLPHSSQSTPHSSQLPPISTQSTLQSTQSSPRSTQSSSLSTQPSSESITSSLASSRISTQSTLQSTQSSPRSTQPTSKSITSSLASSLISTQSTPQSTRSAPHSTQSLPQSSRSTPGSTQLQPTSPQSTLQSTQSSPPSTQPSSQSTQSSTTKSTPLQYMSTSRITTQVSTLQVTTQMLTTVKTTASTPFCPVLMVNTSSLSTIILTRINSSAYCVLPYTSGGTLYNTAVDLFRMNATGCTLGSGTWIKCTPNTGYVAQYTAVNITIPSIVGSVPVLSIYNWIVIQQRIDGSVSFNRGWTDYMNGFGDLSNIWLGLEKVYQLTKAQPYKLRIEIQATSNSKWFSTEYSSFYLDSSSNFYAIHVSGYSGDAGDGFNPPSNFAVAQCVTNGMKFTTSDKDNDNACGAMFFGSCISNTNCASQFYGGGGGWYNGCGYFNLNDPYGSTYFYWHGLTDMNLASAYQLQASRMMIKVA